MIIQGRQGPRVGGGFEGAVDLQVFHPPTTLRQGRPDWLAMGGRRHAVAIPAALARPGTLVQAFVAKEAEDAISIDQVVVGEIAPALLLPAGEFRLVVQDEAGRELGRDRMIVAPGP